MFTGIIIDVSPVLKAKMRDQVMEVTLRCPSSVQEIREGDSVSVDGVCLTIEKLKDEKMIFSLAFDTLKATRWTVEKLEGKMMNLELALQVNDRLGGHYVTGHIDGMAEVEKVSHKGENQFLVVKIPKGFEPFLWKKGYISLNGISLTIQEVFENNRIRLGLVPETLKRTNLSLLKTGSFITFEICYLARAWWNYFKNADQFKK